MKQQRIPIAVALAINVGAVLAEEANEPEPLLETIPVAQQEPPPAKEPPKGRERSIEEIIVTARRVEESLQDTPLSVTALDGDQLKASGVVEIGDLAGTVPSVQVQPTTGRKTAASFAVRGQKASDVVIVNDPSVGVYMAEIPLMRPYGIASMGLLDIQSVQVLKGPQGTLFGRNTTGGAVLITPTTPTDVFEGSFRTGYGEFNATQIEGIVNVPVTASFALRLAANYSHQGDGNVTNRSGSTATVPQSVQEQTPDDRYTRGLGRDFGIGDVLTYRVSARWDLSDRVRSLTYLSGSRTDTTGFGSPVREANPSGLADLLYEGAFTAAAEAQRQADFYSVQSGVGAYSRLSTLTLSNTTSVDLWDSVTVKNIAGFHRIRNEDLSDIDGVASAAAIDLTQVSIIDQFSEELQFTGIGFDERLNWIAGLFYFVESGEDRAYGPLLAGAAGGTVNVIRVPNRAGASDARNQSYSAFAQGTWAFSDRLNLTLGLRYTRDERQVTSEARQGDPNLPPVHPNGQTCNIEDDNGVPRMIEDCRVTLKDDFSEPTWNISLDYRLTDTQLVYAAHRHGYRSGGFNSQIDSKAQRKPFESETVDDIELGYKGDLTLLGAPFRLNLAAYSSDYQNIQRLLVDPSLTRFVVNAASATIVGGELEITWLPLDALTVSSFYSMQRARYEEFTSLSGEDLSDNRFSAIPDHQAGLTLRWQLPMDAAFGELVAQGNAYWQSDAELWDETMPGTHQDAYMLYGARIEWNQIAGSRLSAALWGRNLANEEYYVGSLGLYNLFGFTNGYVGEPRTLGLELSYRFGG